MIIDASVALKWLAPEDKSDLAIGLIGQDDLIVPTLLHCEVGNALWKKAARGEVVLDELAAQMETLVSLVRTVDETPLIPQALRIAADLGHPIYDCVYLALAGAFDDKILTADLRFLRAVAQSEYESRVSAL